MGANDMDLTPQAVEAIARRVAELLKEPDTRPAAPAATARGPVPLLPVHEPTERHRESTTVQRPDLAPGLYEAPSRRRW